MKQLWVDKYRPKTMDKYVFRDDTLRKQFEKWIKEGSIPHILFAGSPGTGKTSAALMLLNELNVEPADIMFVNASRDNGINMIRHKITAFSETMPWGNFKVIILDEADNLTQDGFDALRGSIEQYSSVVRFILTCNSPNKIHPAIHSRCQSIYLNSLDENDFAVRLAEILIDENVHFDLGILDSYIRATYPDLRKTIQTVQLNVLDGVLQSPSKDDSISTEWKLQMVSLFKEGKILEARKHICKHIRQDEYIETFQFLYRNLDFFAKTEDLKDEAILIIRNGLVKHSQIADPEINLSATLIELSRL
jgi:replication factor C small subunit